MLQGDIDFVKFWAHKIAKEEIELAIKSLKEELKVKEESKVKPQVIKAEPSLAGLTKKEVKENAK